MSEPVFSVVIPSYNYGRYLDACLDSIFGQQDAPDFEIVVVDDGSTDDTLDVLDRRRDPRLRVVRQPINQGHAVTINTALPLTRGRIVSRIDPDDRYRPRFMRTMVDLLDRHPAAVLAYGRAAIIDSAGRETGDLTRELRETAGSGPELVPLLRRNYICAPTVAARREGWIGALPVPTHLAFHDWFFTVHMARSGHFCYVPEVVAEYRVHDANLHSAIARSGAEERSVLWFLDHVFDRPEADPEAEAAKQAARRSVYAAHYLDFADKYFWFDRGAEARRCYLAAVRRQPSLLARPAVLRRLIATLMGLDLYRRLKGRAAGIAG